MLKQIKQNKVQALGLARSSADCFFYICDMTYYKQNKKKTFLLPR